MRSPITVQATLQADGVTLQLESKLGLPPGRVLVTVQSASASPGSPILEVLDRIHGEQQKRGRRSMTDDEMAAEIADMRTEDDEYEERWRHIWSQTGEKTETRDDS